MLRAAIFALVLLAGGPSGAAPGGGITVPFELERNRVVISARINGSRPIRLILDTGMVNGVLLRQSDLAREIGLKPSRKIIVDGAGAGDPIEADVAHGAVVVIGGRAILRWQPVVIMPSDSAYSRMSRHLNADGVIGHSLFEQFVVEIDHDKRVVTFHPRDTAVSTDGGTVLPISIEGRKPYVKARIVLESGRSLAVKLVVDTGASRCLYLNPESHPAIRPPERSVETTLGHGVLGKQRGHVGRIRGLRLGAIELEDVVTAFPEARMRGLSADRHGLLGNELLGRFNIVFDYGRRRMILRRNSRFEHPTEYDMVGLQFEPGPDRRDRFTVDDVIPGSPAHLAGILVGDVLNAIDGQPAEELTPTEVERMFRERAGREYLLDLTRGTERVAVTVRLSRLI